MSDKKFRIANRRIMLTYKTHLDKNAYLAWLLEKGKATTFARLAHEKGDSEDGYDHTHVLIKYAQQFQTVDQRYFDYEGIHPHIRPVCTETHWSNALRYIAKEDHSNDDVIPVGFFDKIVRFDTIQDALRSCESSAEVLGTIAAFKHKPMEEYVAVPPTEWRPWQTTVLTWLADRVDDRKIIWICDRTGGCGKSTLARYIEDFMDGILLTQMGGQRDCATILQSESRLNDRPIVVDLPRGSEDKQIWDPLEAIKNGRMTAVKYAGGRMRWRPGHVIVFANFAPHSWVWSKDRYFTWEINPETQDVVRLTL